MIAHRGAWGAGIAENSLAAFARAIELGADMAEFDVRRSHAGELVIFHDPTVAGTPVAALTREQIGRRTGELPPLLEEALALMEGRITPWVELKEDGYVEPVAGVLRGFVAGGRDLIVTSFLDPVVAQVATHLPSVSRGLVIEESARGAVQRAQDCEAGMLVAQLHLVNERLLAEVSAAGLALVVWDFMAASDAALLSDPRIGGVITDDVPAAVAAVAALGP